MFHEHEAREGAQWAPEQVAGEIADQDVALTVDGAQGLLPGLLLGIEQRPEPHAPTVEARAAAFSSPAGLRGGKVGDGSAPHTRDQIATAAAQP
jgi:hypothetical protein